ncbi:conserved Plasmodium protein, unknown function [Plasmodium gallinaceum]|uniref:Uncharacterized protein n=1 Tax=Plasmodium gallinaceum TaxID=5849 RepID=A0A1J1GYU2_PLAGA|nr:conserved Plasmodium protein, unknown function [Plasmodium gallinaceum]CRG96472.1 conserved Plasmodium protein, unknown function [Plasmodium gallinaceum]
MMLNKDDSNNFCVFLNLFRARVNLLEIKKRNEISIQKKKIHHLLLNNEIEKAHANICIMLRNQNIIEVSKKLIALCTDFNSIMFLKKNIHNNDDIKKCLRNILYCSNKLNISNTENLRNNFIKIFGKKYIELIETNFILIDKNIISLINKYHFSYKEIEEVENMLLNEMDEPINVRKDCLCDTCNSIQNNNTLCNLNKKDILDIVNKYSQCAECILDNKKKNIFKSIEKQIILKLNKTLLKN